MTENDLTLELPNFEGPLDLLLHLIKSQKIDIYDIPIARITSQYLTYLKKMQKLNLQLAGEYFVMSSTLLRIKSQYLLPKNDFDQPSEAEEDPREELVEQLVQYSVFKKISAYFKQRNEEAPVLMAKDASIDTQKKVDPLPKGQINPAELAQTFAYLLRRRKWRNPDPISIKMEERPLTALIVYLRDQLKHEQKISFFACASQIDNLADVIGLFLAVLELSNKDEIVIQQQRAFGDLEIERKDKHGDENR